MSDHWQLATLVSLSLSLSISPTLASLSLCLCLPLFLLFLFFVTTRFRSSSWGTKLTFNHSALYLSEAKKSKVPYLFHHIPFSILHFLNFMIDIKPP